MCVFLHRIFLKARRKRNGFHKAEKASTAVTIIRNSFEPFLKDKAFQLIAVSEYTPTEFRYAAGNDNAGQTCFLKSAGSNLCDVFRNYNAGERTYLTESETTNRGNAIWNLDFL